MAAPAGTLSSASAPRGDAVGAVGAVGAAGAAGAADAAGATGTAMPKPPRSATLGARALAGGRCGRSVSSSEAACTFRSLRDAAHMLQHTCYSTHAVHMQQRGRLGLKHTHRLSQCTGGVKYVRCKVRAVYVQPDVPASPARPSGRCQLQAARVAQAPCCRPGRGGQPQSSRSWPGSRPHAAAVHMQYIVHAVYSTCSVLQYSTYSVWYMHMQCMVHAVRAQCACLQATRLAGVITR